MYTKICRVRKNSKFGPSAQQDIGLTAGTHRIRACDNRRGGGHMPAKRELRCNATTTNLEILRMKKGKRPWKQIPARNGRARGDLHSLTRYKLASHPLVVRHRQSLVEHLATQPTTETTTTTTTTGYYRLHYEWMSTSVVNGIWVRDLNSMTITGHKPVTRVKS
jgi:hypothetical protein